MILKIDSRLFWRAKLIKLIVYLCVALTLFIIFFVSLYSTTPTQQRGAGILEFISVFLHASPFLWQIPLAFFLMPVIIWMSELSPDYGEYNSLLTIDEHGIRYYCPRQPLYSWSLAWAEVQAPVYLHRLFWSSALYIPQRRGDGSAPTFLARFLALSSRYGRQRVWRIRHAAYWRCSGSSADSASQPIVSAITAHLGAGAVKTTCRLPSFMSEDARLTRSSMLALRFPRWMREDIGRFASWISAGSLLLFLVGVGLQLYAEPKIRLLSYPLLLWLALALASVVSAVFLLRRTKATWPVSVFVGSLCGMTLVWCLFTVACMQTAQWGERSVVRFELQRLPQRLLPSPSVKQQLSASPQYWRSVAAEAPLSLTVPENMMASHHELGAQLDLPVRSSLGIYVLVLDESLGVFNRHER